MKKSAVLFILSIMFIAIVALVMVQVHLESKHNRLINDIIQEREAAYTRFNDMLAMECSMYDSLRYYDTKIIVLESLILKVSPENFTGEALEKIDAPKDKTALFIKRIDRSIKITDKYIKLWK